MTSSHSDVFNLLVEILNWAGTFVFALSGALLGVKKQFDLFGVLLLSFVVAVAGGVLRDILIGDAPPAGIHQVHYFLIAIAGGFITFYWYPKVASRQQQMLIFDAVGLGLFAVVGAQKAIDFGINPVMVAVLGMLTGIGGGMMRDILAGEVPFVLRSDLYALAALAAGSIVAIGHLLDIPPTYPMLIGAIVCIFLRFMAIYRGWRLPTARWESHLRKVKDPNEQNESPK